MVSPLRRPPRSASVLTAYVLHRHDWSESSLILDVLTREQGRLAVVAKGAKRPYSQLRSVLLPFQRLQMALGRVLREGEAQEEPAREVQTLRSAEWAGNAAMLTGAALFSGFYLNELLMRLLARSDPHAFLFDAYAETLPALGGPTGAPDDSRVQAALRAFELVLLREMGVLPELSRVTLTLQPVDLETGYQLLPEAGVAQAPAGSAALSGRQLVQLQAALQHGSLEALQQACALALGGLRPLLRSLLHYHLGSPVLRTRQVMLDVQSL